MTTNVVEITHIVYRVKSLTVPRSTEQPSEADLLVSRLLLLLSPRRVNSLLGDCRLFLRAAVSSTISVELDCETQSWSASLLAAAMQDISFLGAGLGYCMSAFRSLASASDMHFWLSILHSLEVFAVQPILHVYIERSGYAMEEAPPDEDIHPPSHKEKILEGKQQLASRRQHM